MHVRHATLEDCAVALELLRRFFQEEGFTTSPERMEAPLRELITDSHSAVLLAWEGAVAVAGTNRGHPVHGRGYVELTGYARSMQGVF